MPSLPSPPDTTITATVPPHRSKAYLPASLGQNTDAIALRAALSILLVQRQQAEHDIFALDDLNAAARQDPEGFVQALREGKLAALESHTDDGEDLRGRKRRRVSGEGDGAEEESGSNGEEDAESEEEASSATEGTAVGDEARQFPRFPAPQNIIRCPPVNWAKYRILNEPLERIYDTEKTAPTLGVPAPAAVSAGGVDEAVVIAATVSRGDTTAVSSSSLATAPQSLTTRPSPAAKVPSKEGMPRSTPPIVVRVPPLPPHSGIMGENTRGEDLIAAPYRPLEDKVSVAGKQRPRKPPVPQKVKGDKAGNIGAREAARDSAVQNEKEGDKMDVVEDSDEEEDEEESEEEDDDEEDGSEEEGEGDEDEEEAEEVVQIVEAKTKGKGRKAKNAPSTVQAPAPTKKRASKRRAAADKGTAASRTRSKKP